MSQNFPFDHFFQANSTPSPVLPTGKLPATPDKESTENTESDFSQEELQFVTDGILAEIVKRVPTPKYAAYFDKTFSLRNISDGTVCFAVTTPFIKSMIENYYLESIDESILAVLGKKFEIVIQVIGNDQDKQIPVPSKPLIKTEAKEQITSAKQASFVLDLQPTSEDKISSAESEYIEHVKSEPQFAQIDPKKTFANYVVGPSNNLAWATAFAVAKDPGRKGQYPSLYLHSSSGLGKTHLLHAMANGIRNNHPHLAISLITARDFMKEMIDSIQSNKRSQFQKKYSEQIDVLMIDDIHELSNKLQTQEEFFHVFNSLYHNGKQLIFTSDKDPNEITGIEDRIKTRLQSCLVVDIQKPDLETRIAILKNKANEHDLYLSEEIYVLIASAVKSNIRELEGQIVHLKAYHNVMQVEIDAETARKVLRLNEIKEQKEINAEIIAKTVAAFYRIPMADLKSKSRTAKFTKPRHIAMYLTNKLTKLTLNEIGQFYNGKHHSSVIHAIDKVKEAMDSDATLSRDVVSLENSL